MKLGIIGVGNGGSKVVDEMLAFERETNRDICRHTIVINTARTDLAKPENVPADRRLLIGDTHRKSKGHGAGGSVDDGADIAQKDLDEVRRSFDDVEIHDVDAILVSASLGGGTGAGAGPVVLKALQEMYDEPVYALGLLPGGSEGGRPALNAARSLQSFVNLSDNFIGFDNDAWRSAETSVEQAYDRMNRELATRVVTLFGAGEVTGKTVAENAMDSSDIIRTLETGGISTIGYASTEVEPDPKRGILGRFRKPRSRDENSKNASRLFGLVRRATKSRLTLPADIDSADRALVVLAGPTTSLSRKGLESAREWLEEEVDTVEVLAGDDPRPRDDRLAAVVLLSSVTDAPRIKQIQDQAIAAKDKIDEMDAVRDEGILRLITDDEGEIDPVI